MNKIFLILVMLVLFSVSCGKVSTNSIDSYITLTSVQVKHCITNSVPQWLDNVHLKDNAYVIPTEAWVKKKFSSELGNFLFDYNVTRYQEERNDCDDFALYGRAIAAVLNRHNPQGRGKGIAVGEADVLWGLDSHAMNFIIVAGPDKKPKLLFYEPQTQNIVPNMQTNYNFFVLRYEM